jgi:hypothetical protein
MWSSGYDARFTRERSGVRSPLSVLFFSFFNLPQFSLPRIFPVKGGITFIQYVQMKDISVSTHAVGKSDADFKVLIIFANNSTDSSASLFSLATSFLYLFNFYSTNLITN